ncbi:MAG: 3-oxoacyl-[acyl-carrier-protein] reductase [Hespellia sp.]|jgi:3-oxoacyl-[acyl-carrier protein] reductase|nr:3-oxoacyl-[acyl-carrier-protein] reductase [Hespellia sp.]
MLKGKIAVVTGASRGIGRAVALQLASAGAITVVNYNGSKERAMSVKQQIEDMGGQAEIMQCDVADYVSCETFIKEVIHRFGRIDILVNNAGITRDNLLMRMSEEEFDTVIDTNLKGPFHCARFALRQMVRQRSGRIINIASIAGVMGNSGQANYAASKAGVIGLTKSIAREVASRGITCNAVAPGLIETDMTKALSADMKAKYENQIPLGRLGTAEDVANTVVFLASDAASYITGQVVHVDGGMAM